MMRDGAHDIPARNHSNPPKTRGEGFLAMLQEAGDVGPLELVRDMLEISRATKSTHVKLKGDLNSASGDVRVQANTDDEVLVSIVEADNATRLNALKFLMNLSGLGVEAQQHGQQQFVLVLDGVGIPASGEAVDEEEY